LSKYADFKRLLISYPYHKLCQIRTVYSINKIIAILFILLLLLVRSVYAGSSFQYSRLIQTDNLMGYKSVVLDKAVYAHSDYLNDLRVINDKDEEVPYFLASIQDASTETEKASFILSEEAQYISTQDGTDSIITIQVNHLNAFRLELKIDDLSERTYGLFGINNEATHYLSEGELFTHLLLDSSVKKDIQWTNNPAIDKLRLIIHNHDSEPINPKSVIVYYHLNKLVFKDTVSSQFRLVYGNDTLRSPIYEVLNYKAIIESEGVTQTELGEEVRNPSTIDAAGTTGKYKLLTNIMLATLVLLVLLGVVLRLRKGKRKRNK